MHNHKAKQKSTCWCWVICIIILRVWKEKLSCWCWGLCKKPNFLVSSVGTWFKFHKQQGKTAKKQRKKRKRKSFKSVQSVFLLLHNFPIEWTSRQENRGRTQWPVCFHQRKIISPIESYGWSLWSLLVFTRLVWSFTDSAVPRLAAVIKKVFSTLSGYLAEKHVATPTSNSTVVEDLRSLPSPPQSS